MRKGVETAGRARERVHEGVEKGRGASRWGNGAEPNPKDPPLSPLAALPGMALAVEPNEKGRDADEEPADVHILAAAVTVDILNEGMRTTRTKIGQQHRSRGWYAV